MIANMMGTHRVIICKTDTLVQEVSEDGIQLWHQNGKRHREDGPA